MGTAIDDFREMFRSGNSVGEHSRQFSLYAGILNEDTFVGYAQTINEAAFALGVIINTVRVADNLDNKDAILDAAKNLVYLGMLSEEIHPDMSPEEQDAITAARKEIAQELEVGSIEEARALLEAQRGDFETTLSTAFTKAIQGSQAAITHITDKVPRGDNRPTTEADYDPLLSAAFKLPSKRGEAPPHVGPPPEATPDSSSREAPEAVAPPPEAPSVPATPENQIEEPPHAASSDALAAVKAQLITGNYIGRYRNNNTEAVKALQEMLNEQLGLEGDEALELDGTFGPLTEAAVKQFQESKGIAADGIIGPNTYTRLNGGERDAELDEIYGSMQELARSGATDGQAVNQSEAAAPTQTANGPSTDPNLNRG